MELFKNIKKEENSKIFELVLEDVLKTKLGKYYYFAKKYPEVLEFDKFKQIDIKCESCGHTTDTKHLRFPDFIPENISVSLTEISLIIDYINMYEKNQKFDKFYFYCKNLFNEFKIICNSSEK